MGRKPLWESLFTGFFENAVKAVFLSGPRRRQPRRKARGSSSASQGCGCLVLILLSLIILALQKLGCIAS